MFWGHKINLFLFIIKLWKEEKCAIELIPVKSYTKGLVFLVAKTIKDITNNFIKLAKVFSQQSIRLKGNILLYSNESKYSGPIKACKKFAFP